LCLTVVTCFVARTLLLTSRLASWVGCVAPLGVIWAISVEAWTVKKISTLDLFIILEAVQLIGWLYYVENILFHNKNVEILVFI
jgi:hypothetical protein